jgi:hypothetical protein
VTSAEAAGVVALLDFLLGNSIDEVRRRHRLRSTSETEALIRATLLRHGYGATRFRSK